MTDEQRRSHEPNVPAAHPEEIRLETAFAIGERATAKWTIRTTPAGVICAGLAAAAIILSAAVVRRMGRR